MTEEELKLVEKLRKVEALFAGTTFDGERDAAAGAMDRIRAKLKALRAADPSVEWTFRLPDPWSRQLFLALVRRYNLHPFRYPRQHRTTVMVKAPRRFVNETLWPEYEELNKVLRGHLAGITQRLISESIHGDCSEASVEPAGALIAGGAD